MRIENLNLPLLLPVLSLVTEISLLPFPKFPRTRTRLGPGLKVWFPILSGAAEIRFPVLPLAEIRRLIERHFELRSAAADAVISGLVLSHLLESRIAYVGMIAGFFAKLPFPVLTFVEHVSIRGLADFLLVPLCVVVLVLVVRLLRELTFESFRNIFLLEKSKNVLFLTTTN